jgi:hypothetical protein
MAAAHVKRQVYASALLAGWPPVNAAKSPRRRVMAKLRGDCSNVTGPKQGVADGTGCVLCRSLDERKGSRQTAWSIFAV